MISKKKGDKRARKTNLWLPNNGKIRIRVQEPKLTYKKTEIDRIRI